MLQKWTSFANIEQMNGFAFFGVRRFPAALFCLFLLENRKNKSGGKAPHSKKSKAQMNTPRNEMKKTKDPKIMTTSTASWAAALLLQRCPHCNKGRIFDGLFSMHTTCPVCELPFRREEGFWLGAMYCSYAFAVLILLPLFFFFQWLFPSWSGMLTATVAIVFYVPFTPVIFRYSRVLWIFFEDYVEPRGLYQPRR